LCTSSDDRARAIIAATFRQRLVRADHATRVLARMVRARRRTLIAEAVADGVLGAHSLPEADFLRLCRRAALPVPLLQHRRRAEQGRCRYLDGYFPEWGVHVEIDGGPPSRRPAGVDVLEMAGVDVLEILCASPSNSGDSRTRSRNFRRGLPCRP
jgi:hypothetical protein